MEILSSFTHDVPNLYDFCSSVEHKYMIYPFKIVVKTKLYKKCKCSYKSL